MRFGIASVVGGLVGMAFGALWYGLFAGQWQAAVGVTQDQITNMGATAYILPLVCWIVAAAALNGIFYRLASRSLTDLLLTTVMVWAAGALIATVLSTVFALKGMDLLWIDGLHLLLALLIITVISKFIAHRDG